MRTLAYVVGFIVALLALAWVIQGNEFFLYKFWGPRMEGVRREVFEQTKSYRQGMIQELQNMQFQYEQAKPEHRQALASLILHRAADVPDDAMTPDLHEFIRGLRTKGSGR